MDNGHNCQCSGYCASCERNAEAVALGNAVMHDLYKLRDIQAGGLRNYMRERIEAATADWPTAENKLLTEYKSLLGAIE